MQESLGPVNYDDKIPNNVGLSSDRRLQRAMEQWHPGYIDWWMDMGPNGFQDCDVYLRTAVDVGAKGWVKFGFVKMPEYRWGILLAPKEENRKINFGQHKGQDAWQDVPGEYRSLLRRLIVIQGDTEPASVEQQRYLGKTAPSLYDMRNLFQVNVEEGRHLWAMVYLLQRYFSKDGREEADGLLKRRSGDMDKPRILGAFNEETPDWLSFFMFTFFTDRDGKMQLEALKESGFDPLSRTCRFMLMEEAHHMFVGETGVGRIVQQTAEVMKEARIDDPYDTEKIRSLGVIDLPLIQRKLNFHLSATLDLFGAEISTNGANAFNAGIKGRFRETMLRDDHQLLGDTYPVVKLQDGQFVSEQVPALSAINLRLRDDFIEDCLTGVERWNKAISDAGIDFKLRMPHQAFNRLIGHFSGAHVSPMGEVVTSDKWNRTREEWLPNASDGAFITELMKPETVPGKYASWIAPPSKQIDNKPGDFRYVKLDDAQQANEADSDS